MIHEYWKKVAVSNGANGANARLKMAIANKLK